MPKCMAVVNQKGGVGKTTTTVNLAAALGGMGRTVLVVDMDPQANATSGLGVDRARLDKSSHDLIMAPAEADPGAELAAATVRSAVEGVDIVPASITLAGADIRLATTIARDTKLRRALEPARKVYNQILIDTGPSLGILTINSLAASDAVIIPIQCEYYALEGLSQLLETVHAVQAQINPGLEIHGVVLTMYDGRTSLSKAVAKDVRRHFRGRVFAVTIPRNVRLAEAPSHGLPGVIYDPESSGARAYLNLAREVFGDDQKRSRARA